MTPLDYWKFLPLGYLLSVAIETPILCLGLSSRHPWQDRVLAGLWLTACTYPIVFIVLPLEMYPAASRGVYLAVGETFAPLAECMLFWAAYGSRAERWKRSMWQDLGAVVLANLASFLIGDSAGFGDWVLRKVQHVVSRRGRSAVGAVPPSNAGRQRVGLPRSCGRVANTRGSSGDIARVGLGRR